MRAGWPGLVLLLAGCAASGGWSKTGTDSAAAAREYQDCRELADTGLETLTGGRLRRLKPWLGDRG